MAKIKPRVFEDAEILFRNFEGRESQFNDKGDKEFVLVLPEEAAKDMGAEGWNIKILEPRDQDEDDEEDAAQAQEKLGRPIVRVKVSYKFRPPTVVLITSRGMTRLGEAELAMLDWAEISTIDLILSGSAWDVNGKQGVKAYLQSAYITIEEDPLQLKYGDLMLAGAPVEPPDPLS
jgi:hypothetical protein